VVLAVSEDAGELEQAVKTTAGEGWCSGCGVRARLHDSASQLGAGSSGGGPAGDAGLGQAGLAVRRAAMAAADLDRDFTGDPAAGGVDGAGPAGGVSAGQTAGADPGRGGGRVRGWLATVMAAVRDYG
jgi:hypothetical protein